MAADQVKIHFDPIGNTLNLWWAEPDDKSRAEESATSDDVMIFNKKGELIGLEKLNFLPEEVDPVKYLQGKIKKKLDVFFLKQTDKQQLLGIN